MKRASENVSGHLLLGFFLITLYKDSFLSVFLVKIWHFQVLRIMFDALHHNINWQQATFNSCMLKHMLLGNSC